jgi:hypothetical protein
MGGSVNEEIKAQWVAALRSGEYEQGTGYLNADGKYCCLGVLCELAYEAGAVTKYSNLSPAEYGPAGDALVLPYYVQNWAGLYDQTVDVETHGYDRIPLSVLNDGGESYDSYSFTQIADLIESQL